MEHANHPDAAGVRALIYTRGIPHTDLHLYQEDSCRRFVEVWSWQVVGVYRDEWRPGPGLAAAIAEAPEHRASVVVVHSLNSLGEPAEACRLISALSGSGMGVVEALYGAPFVPEELSGAKVIPLAPVHGAPPRARKRARRRARASQGTAR